MSSRLSDIRLAFIDFFVGRGHTHVRSSPLVPEGDDSLLFTNAGMVQFKDLFLGRGVAPYKCAVTSQKCLRVGGKHNDLENVGFTTRHHTFFEMLGNFSFGDYFKEDAIAMAWEFLTKVLALPQDRLYITVSNMDGESRSIWKRVSALPDHRIVSVVGDDNFWSMGSTGPCGPCSEIFYDYGEEYCGTLTEAKYDPDERYTEIWNLVFMQSNLHQDGSMTELPSKCIDTGMGLERMAAVCQGVRDNYSIDVFKRMIAEIGSITESHDLADPAMRVIADHVRAAVFLMAEGVLPGNVGREYALRKVVRRALRYAGKLPNSKLLLGKLAPLVIDIMGDYYPEIVQHQRIISALNDEEEKFADTINSGVQFLNKSLAERGRDLPDDLAFRLYDTYGFPFDLTSEILREHGLTASVEVFDKYMEQQRASGRASWKASASECLDVSRYSDTDFVGYDQGVADCLVLGIFVGPDGVEHVDAGQDCVVVLDRTPFYAVSGGQLGDIGVLTCGESKIADVVDCAKSGAVHLHVCKSVERLSVGDRIKAEIDEERRFDITCNHSATHMLHFVLRKVLGAHVTQKGSLVAEDRLRFDFSHGKPLSDEEISSIEDCINGYIDERSPVVAEIMSMAEAKKLGAMALFGEKYGDAVRVVSMGGVGASVELCGGSHVRNVGDIRLFKIVSSSSIGSGVRRLEAVTGKRAVDLLYKSYKDCRAVAHMLKVKPDRLVPSVARLLEENTKKSELEGLLSYVQSSSVVMKKIAYLSARFALGDGGCGSVADQDIREYADTSVQAFVDDHNIGRYCDNVFDEFATGNFFVMIIRMSTPRHSDYMQLLAKYLQQVGNGTSPIIIGVEFVSEKFAKFRMLAERMDCIAFIRDLLGGDAKPKMRDGLVWECGFVPGPEGRSFMNGVADKVRTFLGEGEG